MTTSTTPRIQPAINGPLAAAVALIRANVLGDRGAANDVIRGLTIDEVGSVTSVLACLAGAVFVDAHGDEAAGILDLLAAETRR
jgi:hypothetical protein